MVRRVTLAALVLTSLAFAGDEPKWETVVTGPITVKNRARPNSNIKEVWAEGDIDAPPLDVQNTLLAVDRFRDFMPNTKAARTLGKHNPDGSYYAYFELDLPVVTSRDYIIQVWNDELVKPDGSGQFRQHWTAVPNHLPKRKNLVRLETDDGSWHITPKDDGKKSHVVYKFAVDPGGWVPAFAANLGNEQAVPQTFTSVEKEARRLQKLRLAGAGDAGAKPAHDAGR